MVGVVVVEGGVRAEGCPSVGVSGRPWRVKNRPTVTRHWASTAAMTSSAVNTSVSARTCGFPPRRIGSGSPAPFQAIHATSLSWGALAGGIGQDAAVNESRELVRQLLKVMVAYTWFFDTCEDSVLEDRIATKQMEYAVYLLGQLSEADRRRLVDELAELAALETDPAYREFVETFAESMGLTDEDD